ncbi:MAG: sulfatase-like hydrolase/transferase [Chloroflexi bacterium]|nr:sulfatase-like hydrolase/transferase [Chloroflexota bacterium]
MARLPNLLLIMTDQQRASAIRLYGNPDVPTPALERLAARGIRYDQCYTPHPLCVPARVSFWTGRYPHRHGSRTNEVPMPADEPHLARQLHAAGYRLALIGKDHCFTVADHALFSHRDVIGHGGPETCETPGEAAVVQWIRGGRQPGQRRASEARVNPFPAEDCPTTALARRAIRFLQAQRDDQPFCLWLSIPDPHGPLQCPEPYASLHPPDSITLPPWRDGDLAGKMERIRVYEQLLGYADMSVADIRQRVSIYYGMVRFLDDAIGQVLDALDRLGLTDDTIVAFTSDHGDYAGEHRLTDKSSTLLDCMTRVPLLLSWPGRLPAGAVDAHPVSLLDVVPTCLGLAGLPLPAGIDGRVLPGAGDDPPRVAIFSEYGAGGPRLRLADLPRLANVSWEDQTPPIPLLRWREAEGRPKLVRWDQFAYIYDPDDEVDELYDLQTDPWQLTNLATDPAHAAARATGRDHLLTWSIATEGGRPTPIYFDPATGRNMTTPFVPAAR